MGTTKSGRYINTKGTGRSASDYAVIHSTEGTYIQTSGKDSHLRLKSGGHGQSNLNEMNKYGIIYNIVKNYPNGVRVGNVPDHYQKAKRAGINQAWFPANWTTKDIRHAGEHVAGLKKNRHVSNGKIIWGVYKGVRVGVMRTHGKISTIFPDSNQSSVLRRKK
ncbi:MAG: EndoU domain-containing protein [Lachnospiraceae bacterium]|nr:EndoU domain-containing protein [Lachnospiraceae bacterium]